MLSSVTKQLSLALLFTFSFTLSGCSLLNEKVNDVSVQDVPANITTAKQVEKAILIAGQTLNWTMEKTKDNQLIGTQALSNYRALIQIDFTARGYSIQLKESTNLGYNPELHTIRPSYNKAIKDLTNAIDVNLYGR